MKLVPLILLLAVLGVHTASACDAVEWTADSFALCGDAFRIAELAPEYEIRDACVWDDTAILVLGRPGDARGEIVRAFTVQNGSASLAWTAWLQRQRPWRVRAADVDGDDAPELAVGVFNKARFHPVDAERVFIYNLLPGGLSPKWLGTRLSQPMVTFEFSDADPTLPGRELVAVERNADGTHRVAVYNWKGFGYILHSVPVESFAFESMRAANGAIWVNNQPITFAGEES